MLDGPYSGADELINGVLGHVLGCVILCIPITKVLATRENRYVEAQFSHCAANIVVYFRDLRFQRSLFAAQCGMYRGLMRSERGKHARDRPHGNGNGEEREHEGQPAMDGLLYS